jgi:hypothetical protein
VWLLTLLVVVALVAIGALMAYLLLDDPWSLLAGVTPVLA